MIFFFLLFFGDFKPILDCWAMIMNVLNSISFFTALPSIFGWLQACCKCGRLSSGVLRRTPFSIRSSQGKGSSPNWAKHRKHRRILSSDGRHVVILQGYMCKAPVSFRCINAISKIFTEEMIQGLQRIGWKKVDVSFHSAPWPLFAHNNIHVMVKLSFYLVFFYSSLSNII